MTPRRVSFQVYGLPKPKGSARGFIAMKAGKARAIVTSDNKNLKAWESCVRDAAQRVVGEQYFTEAVRMQIEFWFPRPKSVSAKKRPHLTTKPDLSKLIRGAEDALNGVLFRDDSQIIAIIATKAYVEGPAGANITVEEVIDALTAPARTRPDLFTDSPEEPVRPSIHDA